MGKVNSVVETQVKHYGIKIKKSLGQNFLKTNEIPLSMVEALPKKELVCVEVGPGLGILTKELAEVSKKVISYEKDQSLNEVLTDNLRNYNNVQIIYKDFLKADLSKDVPIDQGELAFVSNLPYYITTPILFKALNCDLPFKTYTVMMQKEVADRYLAKTNSPDYNSLSVIAWYLCDIKKIRNVSRNEFVPSPNVDSTIIQLTRRDYPLKVSNQSEFFKMVHECFLLRRKTILNNLTTYLKDKDKAKEVLEKAHILETRRPQELSIEEFIELYEASKC